MSHELYNREFPPYLPLWSNELKIVQLAHLLSRVGHCSKFKIPSCSIGHQRRAMVKRLVTSSCEWSLVVDCLNRQFNGASCPMGALVVFLHWSLSHGDVSLSCSSGLCHTKNILCCFDKIIRNCTAVFYWNLESGFLPLCPIIDVLLLAATWSV